MTTAGGATPKPAAGAIYDLGYARYAGERQPPSKLWRVIMRQQLVHSWKTVWRFKAALLAATIATVVCGAFMYLQSTEEMQTLSRAGAPVSMLDGVLVYGFRVYIFCAFLVTVTVAAPLVARDQETGAFTFYFARPVRARDYVLGKLAAIGVLMSAIFLAGPLVLALFRLALATDTAQLTDRLRWLPKILVVGTLATLTYTALPLALSSLVPRRTLALGLWAGYYAMFATAMAGIGTLVWPPLEAIDPAAAVMSLVVELFHVRFLMTASTAPLWAAVASLILQPALAIFVLFRRVEAQSLGAVGGSS